MKFEELSIPDIFLIKPTQFDDNRGIFMESYHVDKFRSVGIDYVFKQDNYVRSFQNVLRGLHFQISFPQAKLIKCLKGEIYDVAVDMRKESATFAQWIGLELSESNNYQLLIPPGCAHGYYVISENADVSYKCSEIYYPDDQGGVKWNDPKLQIKWPTNNPILSMEDQSLPLFDELKIV